MMNVFLKPIALTIYLLATTTAILFVNPSWGDEVYLDRQCQQVNDSRDAFELT